MKDKRKIVIVCIALFVGGLHFMIGPRYDGPFKHFFRGYLIDILLPFSLYLLCNARVIAMKFKLAAAVGVFLIGVGVETLQYFHVPIFGRTFDPLDFLMYGVGVTLGFLFELFVLSGLDRIKNSSTK